MNKISDSRRVLGEHSEQSIDFWKVLDIIILMLPMLALIFSEVSDILTDFHDLPYSTPRRVLRSGGGVPLLPNVQPRTIEFKRRFQS